MFKEIKSALFSAFLSIVLSALVTLTMTFITGNQGDIIYSSIFAKNKYINSITIKNMQSDEYLKSFNLLIDEKIIIKDNTVYINGERYIVENNNIELDNIKPKEVIIINFETNNEINDNDLLIAKSQQRINIENFNKKENINIYWFILLVCYGVINFIFYLINSIRENRKYDKYHKIIEEEKKQNDLFTRQLKDLFKRENINKTIYIKEINDLEKELNFYQEIILKSTNEKMTKSELEALISTNLKTFSKNKVKNLSHSDIYNIIYGLVEMIESDNKNKEE